MPQVTLSVPHEKLPLLNEVLSALGIETKSMRNLFQKSSFGSNSTESSTDQNTSFFSKHFSWEYFSNELEFE
ncbi:MAG: hypothetical protein JWQ40_1050 [Segetibacter sp.]|nr:hypothetical protein [Segetibacter sp.]